MDASLFIAGKLHVKSRTAMICIAVSFLVMIIAVSVSSGFRNEIRKGVSSISGDVLISTPDLNFLNETKPIGTDASYVEAISRLECVDHVVPTVWRAGIVRHDEGMHGVVIKGRPDAAASDSVELAVSIPKSLSRASGLKVGDKMTTWFVGENMNLRQFEVASVHEDMVDAGGAHIVYASLDDMQRLNGWDDNHASALEVYLAEDYASDAKINNAAGEIGTLINAYLTDDEEYVIATSSVSRYPQLFSWLDLIDFNVFFILMLMTVVAGFNMISGLLIILFEHISMIGLLKSLGMTDKSIAKVFLSASAVITLKAMAVGNAIAILFCVLQDKTHFLRLDPENYYVSFVPVNVDFARIFAADVISFAVIMLLLLIPCLFISKVDPAETVRVR